MMNYDKGGGEAVQHCSRKVAPAQVVGAARSANRSVVSHKVKDSLQHYTH